MPLSLTIKDIIQRLALPEKANIALTGGGGKTTFLGVLGFALKTLGIPVLLITTTKVQRPFPIAVDWLVVREDPGSLVREVRARWRPGTLGLAVSAPYGTHKWAGVTPDWVDALFESAGTGMILNEADGALRLPIKAPDSHEPVIPTTTTHVIPIVGLTALGAPLNESRAFRPHLISKITGLPLGERITEGTIATLITHPQGLAKGAPPGAEIIPFLNQADTPALRTAGAEIARAILSGLDRIAYVIIGRLKPHPMFEVL